MLPALLVSSALLNQTPANAEGLTFRNAHLNVLSETPERNTGLDRIYIVYDTKGVDMLFDSRNPADVKVYKYSNLGGGFAEEISNLSTEGSQVIVSNVEGNMGYIIEDGDKRYYYWVVDYLPYRFSIESVAVSADSDCDATYLDVQGNGGPIHYFTVNGQQKVLDRDITVTYDTQEWEEAANDFVTRQAAKHFESLTSSLRIVPPAYCSTAFHVEGDRFMREWQWLQEAESVVADPRAIMVMTEAAQQERDAASTPAKQKKKRRPIKGTRTEDADTSNPTDSENPDETPSEEKTPSNEILSGDDGLGGSAPATISFLSYGTQGVLHNEWQLSRDPEFEEVEYRFTQKDVDYTFTEEGTFYMRFIGSNSDGTCEAVGDVYTIHIGASELLCPNAFTPDGDGVNDEWKVSYRSLLDFECWIFDRFGEQLFHTKDPQKGWDGMRGGKVVPTGVYYYVINATGADGKKYKKSGDINILRHRSVTTTKN